MAVCGESETEVSGEEGGYGGISSDLNFGVDDGLDDDSDRTAEQGGGEGSAGEVSVGVGIRV
jgi:hypothetical protein